MLGPPAAAAGFGSVSVGLVPLAVGPISNIPGCSMLGARLMPVSTRIRSGSGPYSARRLVSMARPIWTIPAIPP